jgi:hypothetical protein
MRLVRRHQSRQSAKLFLQSSELGLHSTTPLAAGVCAPLPFGPGGRAHSLAGEGLGGGVPIPTRGHTLWCSILKYFVFDGIGSTSSPAACGRLSYNLDPFDIIFPPVQSYSSYSVAMSISSPAVLSPNESSWTMRPFVRCVPVQCIPYWRG